MTSGFSAAERRSRLSDRTLEPFDLTRPAGNAHRYVVPTQLVAETARGRLGVGYITSHDRPDSVRPKLFGAAEHSFAALGAGLVLFSTPSSARVAAVLSGLFGLGITAYCVVKTFNLPDFGPTGAVNSFLPVQGGSGLGVSAHASTVLNAGPFVGIVGGLLMVAGAVALASNPPETAAGEQRASSHTAPA